MILSASRFSILILFKEKVLFGKLTGYCKQDVILKVMRFVKFLT